MILVPKMSPVARAIITGLPYRALARWVVLPWASTATPDGFARKWHILMKGSIVATGKGDRLAAGRAREIGRLLLANERRDT